MPASKWSKPPITPRKIRVNGVELHYIEQGAGEALVLVHGGLGDYRSWEPHLGPFSRRFRVLSYSRRYSYPNKNHVIGRDHSVFAEADDLAATISRLQLGQVHLVGHSYGAYAALVLALERPEVVRSLVLAEPSALCWAKDAPGGDELLDQMANTVWEPVRKAFQDGAIESAIRIFSDGIGGPGYFERLPGSAQTARLQNARALQALMQSSDAFPALSRDAARRLPVPTLIIEGEKTIGIHRLVDDELLRSIPGSERVIIPDAAHGSPADNPQAFNLAVLGFLSKHSPA